jgi:hypothetical protein
VSSFLLKVPTIIPVPVDSVKPARSFGPRCSLLERSITVTRRPVSPRCPSGLSIYSGPKRPYSDHLIWPITPPEGVRGVAKFNRACGFGSDFDEYFANANYNLLTVVQIETETAVKNADEIAAVQGVDVLFIGPLDLSVNLGIAQKFEHQMFIEAMNNVAMACKHHGKAAGSLVPNLDYLPQWIEKGFTFFVVGSDGGCVAKGLQNIHSTCNMFK